MKAVIFADGTCPRISAMTCSPRCLLSFNGRTILDYQLESLSAAGVDKFAIVIGYKGDEIVEHVARNHCLLLDDITFIDNSLFDRTGNIYSLWLASEWMADSKTVCLNDSVLFHPQIIVPAVHTSAEITMIVDDSFRDETMKVIIRDGYVVQMRKAISREEASGTYMGVTTIGVSVIRPLIREIELMLTAGHEREGFDVAVQRLVVKGTKVPYISTQFLPWAEIDDPGGYEFAQQFDWRAMYDTNPATRVACSLYQYYTRGERIQP